MTLSLYIARRFALTLLGVFAAFAALLWLIECLEQLRRFAGRGLGFWQALDLAAMALPESLYRILPLIVILAAMALFLALARSSELVALRAAGRSGLGFLLAPVLTALLFGLLSLAILNPLTAATMKRYDALWAESAAPEAGALAVSGSVSGEGLWLRQAGAAGPWVIFARSAGPGGQGFAGLTFLAFDASGAPLERIAAQSGVLEPGAWTLTGVTRWDLQAANPEAGAEHLANLRLPSELDPDEIRQGFTKPQGVPFFALPAYIGNLERAGFSARPHRVWLQMELAQPLLFAAMVLLAAGFTMRPSRFGGTALLVLLALLAGFAVFFLRNFAQVLGENGQIPPVLAAWAAPLAASLSALGLLLHLEDG